MLKIRFKLRETSQKHFYLYCTFRVNRKAAKSAIATGIQLQKKEWDAKSQKIKNPGRQVDIRKLNHIRNELEETYDFLTRKLNTNSITGEIIKKAYMLNERPSITLLQAYDRLFERLRLLNSRKKISFGEVTNKAVCQM